MFKLSYYEAGRIITWIDRVFNMYSDEHKFNMDLLPREVQPSVRRAINDHNSSPFLKYAMYTTERKGNKVSDILHTMRTTISEKEGGRSINLTIAVCKLGTNRLDELGYIVFTNNSMVIFIDEDLLTLESPTRSLTSLWNLVYSVMSMMRDTNSYNDDTCEIKAAIIANWLVKMNINVDSNEIDNRWMDWTLNSYCCDMAYKLNLLEDCTHVKDAIDTLNAEFDDDSSEIWPRIAKILKEFDDDWKHELGEDAD